jgi:hypothetical protein
MHQCMCTKQDRPSWPRSSLALTRYAPAFTMCFMWSSCSDLKARLQLTSLRCHELCAAEWFLRLHTSCTPIQLVCHGNCWSAGLIVLQLKLSGKRWTTKRKPTPSFNLRTSCFNGQGGWMLWTSSSANIRARAKEGCSSKWAQGQVSLLVNRG